jgi:hypothetical protein
MGFTLRVLVGGYPVSRCSFFAVVLLWKPLSERRREQGLIPMNKIVNDLIAIPTETHITPNRGITRSTTNKLNYTAAYSDIYKHSFIPRTIIDWNNLDPQSVLVQGYMISR